MAKRKTNGKTRAAKPAAAKQQPRKSNSKVIKINGARKKLLNVEHLQIKVDETFGQLDEDFTKINEIFRKADEASKQAELAKQAKRNAKEEIAKPQLSDAETVKDEGSKNYFNVLPIEMTQHIATFLDDDDDTSDKDLSNFAMTCRSTYAAVGHKRSGIWRYRFSQRYDFVPYYRGSLLKKEYQERQQLMRRGSEVMSGRFKREVIVVTMLKKLILQSFGVASTKHGLEKSYSNNFNRIQDLARKSRILDNVSRYIETDTDPSIAHHCAYYSKASRDVEVVQLVLSHMFLRPIAPPPCGFPYSQTTVYGHPANYPILYKDGRLNLEYLLHVVNFFQYYMSDTDDRTLHDPVMTLGLGTPKGWDCPLENGTKELASEWHGAYAVMTDPHGNIPAMRVTAPGSLIFSDDIFTSKLLLDFPQTTLPWPAVFEQHLESLPAELLSVTEENIRYYQFQGAPLGDTKHHIAGILHSLPPQQDVPGFQRVTWMESPAQNGHDSVKDFLEEAGRYTCLKDMEAECSAYEGIVLPGGKIMVGRWWQPKQTPEENLAGLFSPNYKFQRLDTGPFIFWSAT